MSRKGRPPKPDVYRRPNGRISQAAGARPKEETLVVRQPHRRAFAEMLGAKAAEDPRAGFALGRLRLVGMVEEAGEHALVRQVLCGGHAAATGPLGLSERLYDAGRRWAECVGRERFVRASPKDKPSAIAFMTARGVGLSACELGDAEAQRYVREFNDARAALMAAPCAPDVRRALKVLREMARKIPGGEAMLTVLQGLGALTAPAASAKIVAAVNGVVVDDRDPAPEELPSLRHGLAALADHFFGGEAEGGRRALTGVAAPREEQQWPDRLRSGRPQAVELFRRLADGTLVKGVRYGKAPRGFGRGEERGGGRWRERHRSLAGEG